MGFSTTVKVAMWITLFAFFLEAVGFAIPFVFGIVIPNGDITLYAFVGIWYVVACVKGRGIDSCASQAIAQNLGSDYQGNIDGKNITNLANNAGMALGVNVAWLAFQIIMTVGVGLCLLAFLVILCSACYRSTSKKWFIFACIMLFFSALIILGMIALFIAAMELVFVFLFVVGTAENFPWSLLILGIGAILSLVASIIFMVITCNWNRHKYQESDTDSENEVPMSDIQKEGYENRGYDPRNAPPDYSGYPSQYDRPYGQSYVQSQVYPSNYGSSQYEKPHVKYPSQSENMYRPYSQHKY
ncbi:hypothetical protein CHS0354_019468 [Potamilus streckersoni]|uniref:Uncharacterized protein n=1 Tax=Potamilus streckersoni TaxID=2493646 RepID=A0AAE0VWK6_9BIVA|nr:hypothetical protein CHS0354_019468 [Potamilus streckersoni]